MIALWKINGGYMIKSMRLEKSVFTLFFRFYTLFNLLMATLNLKFMYANVLCAAQVKIPVNTLFSDKVAKSVEFWTKSLRMESLAAAIALLNIAGTTLQFSWITQALDGKCRIPLNLYNIIVARNCMQMMILFWY